MIRFADSHPVSGAYQFGEIDVYKRQPEKVFDVPVGTFHRTWLEKIVAENDPRFVKPNSLRKFAS